MKRLFRFREALERVAAAGAPAALVVSGAERVRGGRVGVLPGSFNPPTVAHLELARAAARRFGLDRVVFSLSSVIVDKERVEGLCREDRLLLLSLLTEPEGWGAAVVNRGLYSEQAPAFRARFGGGAELRFIVGMDKVFQIFDPKYYQDRDRALDALFAQARLAAANRGGQGVDELRALLERPENARYRDRVDPLALAAGLEGQSSSAVRRGVEDGAPWQDTLPAAARAFIAATGAFRPGYGQRLAALDALYPARRKAGGEVAFEALLERAAAADGAAVRELLRAPPAPEALMARLRSLGLTRAGGGAGPETRPTGR